MAAAILVASLEQAKAVHLPLAGLDPVGSTSAPLVAPAIALVPSAEQAITVQFALPVMDVQVSPPFWEYRMALPFGAAKIVLPSAEQARETQPLPEPIPVEFQVWP